MNELLMDAGNIALKSFVAASVLFILARIMGKKQISQLNFFDYVVGISIGSIAGALSVEKDISFLDGITSMVIWTAFPIAFFQITSHTMKGKQLYEGSPSILIQNGKIIEKNLKKTKISVNDLLEELREKDVFNIEDVEFALFETNGKVSVLKKSSKQNPASSEPNIQNGKSGLTANVIIDGKVLKKNLQLLNLDENWLKDELRKKQINSPQDVLLACVDSEGSLYIDRKNQDPEPFDVLQ